MTPAEEVKRLADSLDGRVPYGRLDYDEATTIPRALVSWQSACSSSVGRS